MSTKTAKTLTLKLERLIKVPREKVFAAWTTPADIIKWFGPETCTVTSAKINLRIGGKYHFCINNKLDLQGVYREIKAPAKLVYTWNWKGHPDMEFNESLVTVEFVDKKGATQVRLKHEGLPDATQLGQHNHGWSGYLDKLEKMASGAECCPPKIGSFVWNELLAADVPAAAKFYGALFGWKTAPMPGPVPYTIFMNGSEQAGGMLKIPRENVPPHWMAYVTVKNAAATLKKAVKLGGNVIVPPFEVPNIGQIAVLHDPQGAVIGIVQPPKK